MISTNLIKGVSVLFFASTLLLSCKKTIIEQTLPSENAETTQVMTILGKKLPNVHAPENIKLAWEYLKKSDPELTNGVNIDFNPTHQYVKFAPKDYKELKVLQKMYGIDLYDSPAFYEFKLEGEYYHDPSVKNGTPTYQYATLEVGRKLPANIKYELLEHLLLFDTSEESLRLKKLSEGLIFSLEYESCRIKGMNDLAYVKGDPMKRRGFISKDAVSCARCKSKGKVNVF